MPSASYSRRSDLDLIACILDASYRRAGKTEIISRCNMNTEQCEKYLDSILCAGLMAVENDGSNFFFRISSKGKDFLKIYESLQALMK